MGRTWRLDGTKAILSSVAVLALTANVSQAKYSGGTGEPNNPYRIATPNDLNDIGNHVEDYNRCFILVNDINMAGYTYATALIAPDTSSSAYFQGTAFTGIFDGNDCNISNLTIHTAGADNDYLALFGQVEEPGEVLNLGIEDVNITSADYSDYLGGLCGASYYCTISNCYATGSVTGGDYIGGLCGYSREDTIAQCHAIGDVRGDRWVGGLIGYMRNSEVSRCSATGSVQGNWVIGGLICEASGGSVNECYSRCSLNSDSRIGGLVGYIDMSSIADCYAASSINSNVPSGGLIVDNKDSSIISRCYAACSGAGDNGYGLVFDDFRGVYQQCLWDVNISQAQNDIYGKGLPTCLMTSMNTYSLNGWSGAVWTIDDGNDYPHLAWENAPGVPIGEPDIRLQGSGSLRDPYRIETEDDYFLVCLGSYFFDKHLMLVANLDLEAISLKWPMGDKGCPFSGRFNGAGHVISNFFWTTPRNTGGGYGFFGEISENGIVRNLRLEDLNIGGWYSTGGLAGANFGTIDGCFVSGFVDGQDYVGGLVGYHGGGSISQCETKVDATGLYYVGGLIGKILNGEVSQCFSDSSIYTRGGKGGGLVGWNEDEGSIMNSYAMGEVVGNDGSVAGLIYWNKAYVANSYSVARIQGSEHGNTGGLVTTNYGTIEHCFWDMNSSGLTWSEGGVGLTTTEMQTESTFTDAGWDFVNETVNGPNDIWTINETVDYPKHVWPLVNFIGWYVVDFLDYAFLGDYWKDTDCGVSNDCDGTDLDFSDNVDWADLKIFCDHWLDGAGP